MEQFPVGTFVTAGLEGDAAVELGENAENVSGKVGQGKRAQRTLRNC